MAWVCGCAGRPILAPFNQVSTGPILGPFPNRLAVMAVIRGLPHDPYIKKALVARGALEKPA